MSLTYTSATTKENVAFGGWQSYLAMQGGIDGHAYSYTVMKGSLLETRLDNGEYSVPYTGSWQAFDKLLRAAEADIAAGRPGTVAFHGWKKRAYIVGAKHKKNAKGRISTELGIVCVDNAWWRLGGVSLLPNESQSADGLDYPHDYPFDYSAPVVGGGVNTGMLTPCKPRIVFYGPVTDPEIEVSGNLYKVSGNVAAGARIEVDGRDMTVKMIAANGDTTDKFANALRGSGEGGGEYIFQPIPAGAQSVTWDGTYGVDLGWYEEVSEPTWSQS